ncbi:MAG: hypothetical protein ABJF01_01260 [bacterium]
MRRGPPLAVAKLAKLAISALRSGVRGRGGRAVAADRDDGIGRLAPIGAAVLQRRGGADRFARARRVPRMARVCPAMIGGIGPAGGEKNAVRNRRGDRNATCVVLSVDVRVGRLPKPPDSGQEQQRDQRDGYANAIYEFA